MPAAADRDDPVFAYASFLATAARGSLEEGVNVASFRLIDAILKLATILPGLRDQPFFAGLLPELEARFRRAYFMEEAEYKALLDEVIVRFAREIRIREGLDHISTT
jgi:hypothetical protein